MHLRNAYFQCTGSEGFFFWIQTWKTFPVIYYCKLEPQNFLLSPTSLAEGKDALFSSWLLTRMKTFNCACSILILQIQIKITLVIDPATGIDINFSSLLTLHGDQWEAITTDIGTEKDRTENAGLKIETLTNKSSATFLPSSTRVLSHWDSNRAHVKLFGGKKNNLTRLWAWKI